jgi:membrane protein DedA with SNARE-associated domain
MIVMVPGLHSPAAVGDLLAALAPHTYVVVFAASLIDATGIPFPGRIVLAAAGAYAARSEDVSLLLLIALGAAGVVICDHAWYFAGGLGGDRLLGLYCRLTFTSRDCVRRTTDWFERFGPFVILLGRFVAVVRMLTWPVARTRGVRYPTFLTLDLLAALVWTTLWIGLGWLLGEHWARAPAGTRMVGLAVGGLALLAVAIVAVLRRRRPSPRAAVS